MPVGTAGTVKTVHQRELKSDIHAQIILGNTYHLYLRPGIDVLEQAGGLHAFNGWKNPILTDSGGYQVFSLAAQRKITEEGATFKSHIDGSKHLFSPERVMDIERSIGADIVMAFDECTPYPCEEPYARKSMHMTHRWLDRCISRFNNTPPNYGYDQYLFPIVQGSVRQQTLQEKQERLMSGNYIGKGRPIKIESARQQRLQERLSKIANGIEIKRGRPKMVKQEVVEVKQEVVEA